MTMLLFFLCIIILVLASVIIVRIIFADVKIIARPEDTLGYEHKTNKDNNIS